MDELRQSNDGKSSVAIEEFGPAVTNAWNDLRTTTKRLVERAWHSANSPHSPAPMPYDPKADGELIQLLETLDAQPLAAANPETTRQSQRLAQACSNVLMQQTHSAEVFARLIESAHARQD